MKVLIKQSIDLLLLLTFSVSFSAYAIDERKENQPVKILFLGDSLTEGHGIDKKQSYPNIVAKILSEKGVEIDVVNGSVSGSTTASGKSRLKWFSKAKPDYVFLALGGNDILRGIQVEASKKNLVDVIKMAQEKNIKVFLAGMLAPPNYGREYGNSFRQMYLDLQKEYNIPTMPFLLEGVAGEKKYNQEDGIHPNIEGHKIMGEKVAKFLMPIISKS